MVMLQKINECLILYNYQFESISTRRHYFIPGYGTCGSRIQPLPLKGLQQTLQHQFKHLPALFNFTSRAAVSMTINTLSQDGVQLQQMPCLTKVRPKMYIYLALTVIHLLQTSQSFIMLLLLPARLWSFSSHY